MKSIYYLFMLSALLVVWGCNSSDGGSVGEDEMPGVVKDNSGFALRNLTHSGCKKTAMAPRKVVAATQVLDEEEYIEYEGRENGFITINHLNSLFNCGVTNIGAEISVSDNVIRLSEKMTEGSILRCGDCPFDIMIDAGPLVNGVYKMILSKDGKDYGQCTITFSPSAKGKEQVKPLK